MRVILVILFTFLIVRLWYRWRRKKEELKVVKLKELIEQQDSWSTPMFNNGGFVVGTFGFFLGIFSVFSPNYGMPLSIIVVFTLFGLFMIYGTPFIKITKDQIIFQPLLFKILGISISKHSLPFKEIENIVVKQVMPPFNALVISTKSSKRFKLNTALFNSEIGNAIFDVVKSRLTI